MTSLSISRRRLLATARRRPPALKLGALPEDAICRLLAFWRRNQGRNMLSTAFRSREDRQLPLGDMAYLTRFYSQIALQTVRHGGDAQKPQDHTNEVEGGSVGDIEAILGPVCRARIGTLRPGGVIAQHIDDPDQIRVISILSGQHRMTVTTKQTPMRVPMEIGELWFVNTAWPHEVTNPDSLDRVALLLNLEKFPSADAVVTARGDLSACG